MRAELHRRPPWDLSLAARRQESEMVIFALVEQLLRDNHLQPCQVSFLTSRWHEILPSILVQPFILCH